jgi:N-methylhydantoinase A/oxoprolinase/acetone carboxylase beta subunit
VLLDEGLGVVNAAKSLTTKHDLSVGIENAVRDALPDPPPRIDLVSLSSTLATNAIVEGQGNPACLLLIGYDPRIVEQLRSRRLIPDRNIVFVPGGHTVQGDEQCPLDEQAARRAIIAQAPQVTAFAVSGYFGVRNPTHELRVKQMVRSLTGLPVTCGHELTSQLDAPLRAATVALNAHLISLMQRLITEVREFLESRGIDAPLMVVKGDGSLMDAKMALERPVQTILSGPAASVIGALHLCGEKDGLVLDMGGTTTDVAVVKDGVPLLIHTGARVGNWQTMVEALDIHTIGLGGDSEVRRDDNGGLVLGPRRVMPLSLFITAWPSMLPLLETLLADESDPENARFFLRERPLGNHENGLSSIQREIWQSMGNGPVSLLEMLRGVTAPEYFKYCLQGLVEQGLVVPAAFTPTDAAHALGMYSAGSVQAARIGAKIWARRLRQSPKQFCRNVLNRVVLQAGHIVLDTALAAEGNTKVEGRDEIAHLLIDRALGADNGSIGVALNLKHSIVGVGAPSATYLPPLAKKLGTTLHVPENASVANAVGAVVGGVVQSVRILVRRPAGPDNPYRVYSPEGVRDYLSFNNAVNDAKKTARRLARERAREAGAASIRVRMSRRDETASAGGELMHLGTEIIATAMGRPRLRTPA